MPTKITNSLDKITTNDAWYVDIPDAADDYAVTIDFETPGAAGAISVLDAQQNPYFLPDGTAVISVGYDHATAPARNSFIVTATGERIYFTSTAFSGATAAIRVIRQKRSKK